MTRVLAVLAVCLALAGCNPPDASAPNAAAPNSVIPNVAEPTGTVAVKIAEASDRFGIEQTKLEHDINQRRTELDALVAAERATFDQESKQIAAAEKIDTGFAADQLKTASAKRSTEAYRQYKIAAADWESRISAQVERVELIREELSVLEHSVVPAATKRSAGPVAVRQIVRKKLIVPTVPEPAWPKRHDPYAPTVPESAKPKRQNPLDSDADLIPGMTSSPAKIRFIRLEYMGGDWDRNSAANSDLNLLNQYATQTNIRVAQQPEFRTIAQLGNFKRGAAPPLVYLSGSRSIALTKNEFNILRDYLLEQHGMLFLDNGGNSQFHRQAMELMRQVVPEIESVKVPLDDPLYLSPNSVPFQPLVAEHDIRDAYGWKRDGRWIAFYHPANLGGAWSDGHAGVPKTVWEASFNLGVNVIHYAHAEQAKWNLSRRPK